MRWRMLETGPVGRAQRAVDLSWATLYTLARQDTPAQGVLEVRHPNFKLGQW